MDEVGIEVRGEERSEMCGEVRDEERGEVCVIFISTEISCTTIPIPWYLYTKQ